MLSLVTVLLLALHCGHITASPSCRDENGRAVDWFLAYKLPKLDFPEGSNLDEGLAYMYLDVNNQEFGLSDNSINGSSSAITRTLQQVYDANGDDSYEFAFYNDEEPDGKTSSYRGHTKGAFIFDDSQGYWLSLSIPRFPNDVDNGYSYPDSGTHYGQTLLCLTLGYDQFNTLGTHFRYTYPNFYSIQQPSALAAGTPELSYALDGKHVSSAPYSHQATIKTSGRETFTLFGKYKKDEVDIVKDIMAPALATDLFSETWQNGAGTPLPTNCSGSYSVYDVEEVSFTEKLSFSETKDHSKWAAGKDSDWVCPGDLNRQESQESRCGGYACFQNQGVNSQYNQIVTKYGSC